MNKLLLIRIPPPTSVLRANTLVQWGVFAGHGALQGDIHVSELSNVCQEYLASQGENEETTVTEDDYPDEILVFLPGTATVFRNLPVNSGQRKHLHTALPFMIEEDLAEDVDAFHLASQLSADKQSVSVSGFSHQQFQQLLLLLDEQGLWLDKTLPELQLLKTEPGIVTLVLEEKTIIVQAPDESASIVDYEALHIVFDELIRSQSEEANREEYLDDEAKPVTGVKVIYPEGDFPISDNNLERVRSWLGEQGVLVEEQGLNSSIFEYLSGLYFSKRKKVWSFVDLRSGAYQCPKRAGRRFRRWRPLAIVASLWVVLEMGMMIGEGFSFQQKAADYWDQSASLYLDVFPQDRQVLEAVNNEQRTINVKSRLESRLKIPGSSSEGKPFLPLLQTVSLVSASLPEAKIRPISMEFNHTTGNLVLELTAETLESVDELLAATKSAGLMAKLDRANREKSGVNARMTISR